MKEYEKDEEKRKEAGRYQEGENLLWHSGYEVLFVDTCKENKQTKKKEHSEGKQLVGFINHVFNKLFSPAFHLLLQYVLWLSC